MIRLVKAEIYKLIKCTAFRIICIIGLILAGLVIFSSSETFTTFLESTSGLTPEQQTELINATANSGKIVNTGNLGFIMPVNSGAYYTYFAAFGAGVLEIFIGVLVGSMMAKEYTQGTMKNCLAYGKSRVSFYIAKFIGIVMAVVILTAIMAVLSVTVVYFMNGWGCEMTSADIGKMVLTFIASVMGSSSVVAIIMIIASLTRGNGATIGITVVLFILIPNIIGMFYGKSEVFDLIYEITPYYNNALAIAPKAEISDLLKSMMISSGLIIGGLSIGGYIFKRQDIK